MELTKQPNNTGVGVQPGTVGDTEVCTKLNSSTQPAFKSSESNANAQQQLNQSSLNVKSSPDPSQGSSPQTEYNQPHAETGKLASWRGVSMIIITGGAMFMDEVFMTSTNISLSAIQQEFDVQSSNLQWSISAYTLTFGGFLLLSGVLSDRCRVTYPYSISEICC